MSQTTPLTSATPMTAILYALIATLCWAGKVISGDIPPLALAFWRWLVATVFILPFAFHAMYHQRQLAKQHYLSIFLLALFGVATYNSLIYIALNETMAVNVAILQSTSPFVIVVLQFLLLGQGITKLQTIALMMSSLGIAIILLGQQTTSSLFHTGDLITLLAIFAWGAYSVLYQSK
ncbi:DMT family transporter [Thaumasiovibrio subtropicus]|uniref:DMT family transporter n=1 Tax=Thaumasiovibrio subtropicus TaxID=1891207 RepID=UPI000B35726B|nr:DMT family transporter [Thaumasiovibrio subtropicus]